MTDKSLTKDQREGTLMDVMDKVANLTSRLSNLEEYTRSLKYKFYKPIPENTEKAGVVPEKAPETIFDELIRLIKKSNHHIDICTAYLDDISYIIE